MKILFRSIFFALLVATTVWFCLAAPKIQSGDAAGVVMQLPMDLEGFTGEKGEPDPVELKMLPADTKFAKAAYSSRTTDITEKDTVYASIVLSGEERKSIHRPEVCLQGQGWTLLDSKTLPVDMGQGRTLWVKDLYIEKKIKMTDGSQRPLRGHYVYWFVGTDVTTPSHFQRIWLTLRDNIFRNVNHRWAYPSLMAVVTENYTPAEIGQRSRTSEETVAMLTKLIQQMVPTFQKEYMPSHVSTDDTANQ